MEESLNQDDLQEMFGDSKDVQNPQAELETETQATTCPELVTTEVVTQPEVQLESMQSHENKEPGSETKDPANRSEAKTTSEPDFDNTLMFEDGLDRIREAVAHPNQSVLSSFMDCTAIQGIPQSGFWVNQASH